MNGELHPVAKTRTAAIPFNVAWQYWTGLYIGGIAEYIYKGWFRALFKKKKEEKVLFQQYLD